jgi:ketosteroid isomerase-like protein
MRNEADDVASGIIAKWSTRFTRLDADGLASLYSRHAFFFGSNPTLYRGREGVEAYFNGLPRWHAPTVQFAEVKTAMVGSDMINMAAIASFFLREGEPPLSVKISWVIIREDDDWKIVSHHVSSRTPLIDGSGR